MVGAQRMKCRAIGLAAQNWCDEEATRAFLRIRPVSAIVLNGVKSVLPGTVVTVCEKHAKAYVSNCGRDDASFREITLDEALVREVHAE